MKQYYLKVKNSKSKNKRYTAYFYYYDSLGNKITKKVHFGLKGGNTYIDHQDNIKKINYIKRHKKNEDWSNPFTPGALSRYILWNKPTLESSIESFKNKFGFK
jgi:hypothetical protein